MSPGGPKRLDSDMSMNCVITALGDTMDALVAGYNSALFNATEFRWSINIILLA